jgi:hypothetical protein
MSIKVGVRHRNGKINHVVVNGAASWSEARDYVLSQMPSARVVLAVIEGGDRRVSAPEKVAA